MKVAHIDDDDTFRALLAEVITGMGHQVIQAGSIAEGRTLLASASPDVVLCDRRLRDGDGMELLHWMRTHGKQQRFVILTAGPLAPEGGAVTGADLVLQKNGSLQGMEQDIQRALGILEPPVQGT